MTGYLLDTDIVSVFAPGRTDLSRMNEVTPWLLAHAFDSFISIISIMEIERGIRKLDRAGAWRRASELSDWLSQMLGRFSNQLLNVDLDVAHAAATLDDQATAAGRHPGLADVIIAATAEVHALTILTRNLRHFRPLGVAAFDPFTELPETL